MARPQRGELKHENVGDVSRLARLEVEITVYGFTCIQDEKPIFFPYRYLSKMCVKTYLNGRP